MYVCLCHAFTDKQVARMLQDGARTTAGVYRGLGCTPQCGKCVPHVRQMVREHKGCSDLGTPCAEPARVPADAFLLAAE
ncbi:(2Fe-2S)-binding protein [Arenibaculum sp.]|jgi:bacterioferritin-associated ferredoxin|uniref:(2Fe-2S)-binding protein n=1 Tax=Arenibaculum sp. TaxID=2865862 RepID=UPI002E1390DD|nr:(2Fe-2S)-binding protein [Arenibaculum sp.]